MFFITTIRIIDGKIDDQRPVGYFKDYHEAKIRVEGNSYDIFECGYYKYAAIVELNEGLYPNTKSIHWFEYCKITDNVVEISKSPLDRENTPYILG